MFEITEVDIAQFGFSLIKFLGLGPPCEDQSKLCLIMNAAQRKAQRKSGKNPRPGLDDPKGAVFRQCLQIVLWTKKYNPDAEILAENPDLADLIESWTEVCDVLGEPLMISHEDFSTTKRFCAYYRCLSTPHQGLHRLSLMPSWILVSPLGSIRRMARRKSTPAASPGRVILIILKLQLRGLYLLMMTTTKHHSSFERTR